VRQPHLDERLAGEFPLAALDLLQAQDVGRLLSDEAGGLLGPQADRVDVPGADSKAHLT
jgi:hypothetical protein